MARSRTGAAEGRAARRAHAEAAAEEAVDLRCLRPIDFPTLAASVTKTHRAVIVDEGWKTGGLAGELMAGLMERVFYELDGPIRRVCTAEVPIPYAKHMEDHALPTVERVVAAAKESLRG